LAGFFLHGRQRRREESIAMADERSLRGVERVKDRPTWRDDVKERIVVAHKFGIPDETVRAIATKVGEFLAKKVCPTTEEEKLLKEMWKVATRDEKKTITTLIIRMVQ